MFTPALSSSLTVAGHSVYWLAAGTALGAFGEAATLGLAVRRLDTFVFLRILSLATRH